MMDRVVIVFLRAPEKGRVKTRLSKLLNDTFVLELYKAFVEDTLDTLDTVGDKALCFWPPGGKKSLQKWLGKNYDFLVQRGDDIGQKMSAAFADIFKKGYTYAVLIGTDIPELSENMITLAFQTLQTTDAVIGPSGDGGYYLIGFKKSGFSNSIFKGINWSTPRVFDQTLEALDRDSIQYSRLPQLNDIDMPEDLDALARRMKSGGKIGKRTLKLLTSYEN